MNKYFAGSCMVFFTLTACSSLEQPCEDITQIKAQLQACQILQRQINQAKQKPLVRTELERRYQKNCIELRFYRDDKQNAICANKAEIEKIRKTLGQQNK